MECKKCKQKFPNSKWINGKRVYLHRRIYCLVCSPLNEKSGYKLRKELTTKNRFGNKECPICKKRFKYTKNNICSGCRMSSLRYEQRKRAYKILGECCKGCGVNDQDILTFHHRNPEEKSFNLCSSWGIIKWELILKELEKCDLLCANCHLKIHATENQSKFKLIEAYYSVL